MVMMMVMINDDVVNYIQTDLESFAGPLYIQSVFNRMKKRFVCIRDQFMYIYTSDVPDQLKTVVFIEGATVDVYVVIDCE